MAQTFSGKNPQERIMSNFITSVAENQTEFWFFHYGGKDEKMARGF